MSKRTKLNTIRIIAGQWRGRRLSVANVQGLRPTTDRVRETLFNWLALEIEGARCLDAFAGTGALGLESLSRGAKFVQFIETDLQAKENLQQNLKQLNHDLDNFNSEIIAGNTIELLSCEPSKKFEIVFLDPPFQSKLLALSMQLLVENNWLSKEAIIYVEQSANDQLPELPAAWQIHRQGKAGQSAYYLLRTA